MIDARPSSVSHRVRLAEYPVGRHVPVLGCDRPFGASREVRLVFYDSRPAGSHAT